MPLAQATKLDDLLHEARMVYAVVPIAIAKQIHADTGKCSGEFPCPRCYVGTLRWSVAECNGHAAVLCSTRYVGEDGKSYSCTHVIE